MKRVRKASRPVYPIESCTCHPKQVTDGQDTEILSQEKGEQHQAEQEWDRFLALSSDILAIVKFDGYFKRLSPACERILGFSQAELLTQPFLEFVHPDDRAATIAVVQRLATGERIDGFENRYRCKDNSYKWLSWSGVAAVDEELIYCTARDISNQKQMENTLQESEARFRAFMQNTPTAAWITDADGRVVYLNENYCHTVQLLDAHPIGKTVFDLFPAAVAQPWMSNIRHVVDTQQTMKTIEMGPKTDGTTGTFLVYKFPMSNYAGVCLVGGVAVDISELKRTEAALRESEERFRQIAENIREVFWIADVDFTHLFYVSPAYEEIWGQTCQSLYEHPRSFVEAIHQEDKEQVLAVLEQQRHIGFSHEYRIVQPNGSLRWIWERAFTINDSAGNPYRVVGISQDITERKQSEEALSLADFSFERSAVAATWIGSDARILRVNEGACQMLGYSREELHAKYVYEIDPNVPQETWSDHWRRLQQQKTMTFASRLQRKDGTLVPVELTLNYLEFNGKEYNFAFARDISEQLQAEADLRYQREQEQLVVSITQKIRQSLNLEEVLSVTVQEVRRVLEADRVLIFQLHPDGSGIIVKEAVSPECPVTQEMRWLDECFPAECYEFYRQGKVRIVPDVATDDWGACLAPFMQSVGVKSKVVAPIVQVAEAASESRVWGLLIAHACAEQRQWLPIEAELLEHLSGKLAIAIQQAELHQQVQQLNANLESQVQKRTAELQQALKLEALLKRITDKVRDSLDETQILQTAVQELAIGLNVSCCDIAFYNVEQQSSTIVCEYIISDVSSVDSSTFSFSNLPDLYDQLLQGQHAQFSTLSATYFWRHGTAPHLTVLSCPMMDEQGVVFGDLWLFKPCEDYFNEQEVRLVKQVANQCVIALRQSRLYQAAQAQVTELERLNHLKDDFLSTVSHELRTPMSNIKMAIQMLEVMRSQASPANSTLDRSDRYFNILRSECEREISLINDLLDLARLEASVEPLNLLTIDPQIWIPSVLEPFEHRVSHQRQHLQICIPATLPPITTDLSYLERILSELLNNACKYTPAGETIRVAVKTVPEAEGNQKLTSSLFLITVSNSGVEIPASELEHIFDKFYRVPNNDPWKHGGTGLGLALVKRLVGRFNGKIEASSSQMQTTFAIQLPLISDNQLQV